MLLTLIAVALVERALTAKRHTLPVPALRAVVGEGELLLFVEAGFLRNDYKLFTALRILTSQ